MAEGKGSVLSKTRPKEICWIDCQISSMRTLNFHKDLVSLNLHCNSITKIEGLEILENLQHLDLSSNQIHRIEGLARLISLRTVNLSCNQLRQVEGLDNLQSLVKLDLSYNMVNNISGLKDLHGSDYNLSTLHLHGNHITSLDHVINALIGCVKLKELSLQLYGEGNPVCEVGGYRSSMLSAMRSLEVLDGLDKDGQPAALNEELHIPEFEEYMDYLLSTSSSEAYPTKDVRFDVATPHIDLVLNQFKQRGPLSSDNEQSSANRSPPDKYLDRAKPSVRGQPDQQARLEKLENEIANLMNHRKVQENVKPRTQRRLSHRSSHSEDSADEDHSSKRENKPKTSKTARATRNAPAKPTRILHSGPKRPKTTKTIPQSSSSSTSPTTPRDGIRGDKAALRVSGRAAQPTRGVRPAEEDATLLSLIQELEAERERRWKAEQAGRKLVDHIKTLQDKGSQEKELQDAALTTSARLKEALLKEREVKAGLKNMATELQASNAELTDEIQRLRKSNEEQRKTMRDMEETAGRAETERITQHAHKLSQVQEHQMSAAAANREAELLRHAVKQHKGQLQQLQELLAAREHEHRVSMDGMVKSDSREMRERIDREVAKQEAKHEQVALQYQQRLEKRDAEYAALEDEFRMALQIEANRFKELQEAYERVSEDAAHNKQMIQSATQKENKATSMVNELTAMVKEQRGRLTELSRGKQELVSDYKERILTLEDQLNVSRRQLTRLEILEQDKNKLGAQIRAQESVIEGLRTERKLWSQELAQQGASLASDRGRLESRIEALTAELSQMKKQAQSDNETIRIKAKLIEDQTDSTRKFKQTVKEQEDELKKTREENAKKVTELEQKLVSEMSTNNELQDENGSLRQRKGELKSQLMDSEKELEKTKDGLRSLRSKWQEKSAIISQMETEVVQMRDNFKEKEKALINERDKAVAAGNAAIAKLKACDDSFRRQLESEKQGHEQGLQRIMNEKQNELDQANQRVLDVEDEMRQLLQENALTKKTLEMRVKKLTSAFTEIQQDLAG